MIACQDRLATHRRDTGRHTHRERDMRAQAFAHLAMLCNPLKPAGDGAHCVGPVDGSGSGAYVVLRHDLVVTRQQPAVAESAIAARSCCCCCCCWLDCGTVMVRRWLHPYCCCHCCCEGRCRFCLCCVHIVVTLPVLRTQPLVQAAVLICRRRCNRQLHAQTFMMRNDDLLPRPARDKLRGETGQNGDSLVPGSARWIEFLQRSDGPTRI